MIAMTMVMAKIHNIKRDQNTSALAKNRTTGAKIARIVIANLTNCTGISAIQLMSSDDFWTVTFPPPLEMLVALSDGVKLATMTTNSRKYIIGRTMLTPTMMKEILKTRPIRAFTL